MQLILFWPIAEDLRRLAGGFSSQYKIEGGAKFSRWSERIVW